MGRDYSDEELADWAGVFNNVSDFVVVRGDGQVLLGADLCVRDSTDATLENALLEELLAITSPFPRDSLADRVWMVREASSRIGAEYDYDDTPWGLAGVYLADAMEFVTEDRDLELLAKASRRDADALKNGDHPAPLFKWLFQFEMRRRAATSALAAMFSAQEAAFFECAEWYQLPLRQAEQMSRRGFPGKWTKLFQTAEVTMPDSSSLALVAECFECRHRLVHVPPRIRRTCTPDDVLAALLPQNQELAAWVAALERLLTEYMEALELPVDLPSWESFDTDKEFSRRLREGESIDDLLEAEDEGSG